MKYCSLIAGWCMATTIGCSVAAAPLTTIEYHVSGVALQVTPTALSVPKGIAGSVLVQIVISGGTNTAGTSLADGAYVQATLRGPAFPARKVISQVNGPLLLPAIPLVGDYELDDIKLVDSATGATRMEGSPNRVPIHVFDEVLVSSVTSRPLTYDEIQQRGIDIDQNNFRAVEFEVGFVLNGQTVSVKMPVVAPTFTASTEIIPAAELQARLATASQINQDISSSIQLPKELETARVNVDIQGINFQPVEESDQNLALQIPPIPALMVVPGRIGFLNQFFSVQIFTENGAPAGSGLSVNHVMATMQLPPGPDGILSSNYDNPGDDPLRFARVGPNKIIQPTQPVVQPGPDGIVGTADDISRLQPGQSGQGEFLVEALQEGLQVMNVNLVAELDGLAAGPVQITGSAAGSVLVRNPKFSIAFSHPRTVRAGEPYDAFVTVLNTGSTVANLVQVSLTAASISGGVLESDETVQLGTLEPGQTAIAKFHILAERTGEVAFSNLTTSDDSVVGRFRLSMGIDERGVTLSPDTIGMPDFVNALPPDLLNAANRVLGQAMSVNTAGQLPSGVLNVPQSIITARVLELAEAGQRLAYHDATNRVLADLQLDWQGGRSADPGFDQIIRQTDAGNQFRQALMAAAEAADAFDATARLADRAADLAGRGEPWLLAAASDSSVALSLSDGVNVLKLDRSDIAQSAGYAGGRGNLLAALPGTNQVIEWRVTNALAQAVLSVLQLGTNGTGQLFKWTVTGVSSNVCFHYQPDSGNGLLQVDQNCDGTIESTLASVQLTVTELPPSLVSVIQDPTVNSGRPLKICNGEVPGFPNNYATVLAVLFSKPMTQDKVNVPSAYTLENGNAANAVQIQQGGRVALLNMQRPVGAIIPRTMTVSGVTDPRGNVLTSASRPVESDLHAGCAIHGRVVRADGSPAAGIPVTLTMYDEVDNGFSCDTFTARISQMFSDDNGYFDFDFIMSGMPYSVSATDTGSLSPDAVQLILDSIADSQIQTDKLLQLANSPSAQNTLLQAFALGSLVDVVATAEGLDRALLRDLVPAGSAREGTIVPVALRFRGRGVVTGQVVGADGTTPISHVAVNLFPDPSSRELGRGQFSDANGQFAFYGVPLGVFTIQANTGSGLFRTVSDTIDSPGQTNDITIVLSAAEAPVLTQMQGRVTEADGVTGHSGAQVFIGRYDQLGNYGGVVALATADSGGYWTATNVPVALYDPIAISFDGKRRAERRGVAAVAGSITTVNLALQGVAIVNGIVQTSTGQAVSNALVAGGEALVRSDANGAFTLTGVPTGQRTISVGVERTTTNGPASNPPFDFPRFGNAPLNVLPGIQNFVVVRLDPAGAIVGRVLDSTGHPVPNVTVALPEQGGFQWVDVDANGNYKFENLPLKRYDISAPGPPVDRTDVTGILNTLDDQNAGQDQLQAAIGEAFAIFTGASDPFLNGSGATYNPLDWGFTSAMLAFDGQTVVADVRFLPHSTISGTVVNGQGVPIGARVRLTGTGPLPNGQPAIIVRGEQNSDPALGTFAFAGQALVGDWGLQAASPFFPIVISASGKTTSIDPDVTNIVLQFPATRDVNGRLVGTVFMPDGSLASSNVNVKISFGDNFVIRTGGDGTYDTQIALPALNDTGGPGKGYSVEADDPLSGLHGISTVVVMPGVTNTCNVQLIGKGALQVAVTLANGAPASNAPVQIQGGSFPFDQFSGTTDTNGLVVFQNLFAGPYSVSSSLVSGPTTLSGRSGAPVTAGQTNSVTVTFGPTATIVGTFLQRDLITPVPFAQVAVGSIGFTTTDTNGGFVVSGLPLGSYRLVSQDPVNGIGAVLNVTLSFDGQTNQVLLVEQSRGTVQGRVINSYATGAVPGAEVTISFTDGITPTRTVTTGPQGDYSFPGTPAGAFSLQAHDPATDLSGFNSGVLPENAATFQIDVPLEPRATLAGHVFQPDGISPATNATVLLIGPGPALAADTDGQGQVAFANLPIGNYGLRAFSLAPDQTRSTVQTNLFISTFGPAANFNVALSGVGAITGTVRLSDGVTPAAGATVVLNFDSLLFSSDAEVVLADSNGQFSFTNVAAGGFRLSAVSAALAATFNGMITNAGQVAVANLVLGASGTVQGRLVRQDGVTPMPDVDVLLSFASQSGLPGRVVAGTDSNGQFSAANIPVGAFSLEAIASSVAGIARLASALISNGQVLDLGTIRLDEDDPFVVTVNPANTTVGVPITNAMDLVFNEALATNSINTQGIFVRVTGDTNEQPVRLDLLPDPTNNIPRLVRLTPLAPLKSLKTYEIVVVDGNRLDPLGNIIASGPTDLVGRPLVTPFVSRFTTADNDPPLLLSLFPTNGQIQIDPLSVMRLSFNEPIQTNGIAFFVLGTNGPVAGTASVGLNGLVLTFAPNAPLAVNTTYTLIVSNVFDLAGNAATGQPFTATFATLDTIGPTIASLGIADGKSPIASATVPIQATLLGTEPSASVRFSQDFNPIGTATSPPFRINATLPATGSTTIRAIATDRFGNDGPFAELVLTVVSNQPPTLFLARGSPASGPLTNGQSFTLQVSATDDLAVSNVVVVGLGALPFVTNFTSGATQTLAFTVPPTALPGDLFQFQAQAVDALGVSSTEAVLDLGIVDVVPPALAIISPADNAVLNSNQPLNLVVASSDNNTNHQLQVVLSGGLNSTQNLAVAAAPRALVTNIFNFSLSNAPTTGVSIVASVQATDTAGNKTATNRTFRLPDTRPPQLAAANPTNGATGVSLWFDTLAYDFDEPMDPTTFATNRVVLTNNAAIATPFSLSVINGNQRLLVNLSLPLAPGVIYTNLLLPGFTDLSSNSWQSLGGSNVPPEGVPFVFATARILSVTPASGTTVTAGQDIPVGVTYDPSLGAGFFRFQITGSGAVDIPAGGSSASTVLSVPLFVTQAVVTITASPDGTFTRPVALAPLVLNVQPDTTPPILLSASPSNAMPRQSLWSGWRFNFDKKLDPATVSNNITVTSSAGAPVSFTVSLANTNRTVLVAPALPLQPGVTYTNTLLPGIADLSGNDWRNLGNTPVPPQGAPFSFTTASILDVEPANGSTFFTGQGVPVSVSYEPGLGASFFRFLIEGQPPSDVAGGPTNASTLLFMPNSPTQAVLHIFTSPDSTLSQAYQLPPIALNIINAITNTGIVFAGANEMDLVEGSVATLTLTVTGTNSPLTLVDYAPDKLPPAFVSFKSRTFANTGSNGFATVQLEFNPLHDAAGSYNFTLHAATAAGQSGTFDVKVVVADNPALAETHWKDPVDGNWSDASKWSGGLPAAGVVAVIDAAGTYTVNLDTSVSASGVVLNESNAVLQATTGLTINAPLELRAGEFSINGSVGITFNGALANRDRLHWISGCHIFNIQGSGRIENLGLFEVFQDSSCFNGSESVIQVPVNIGSVGKLLLSSNAFLDFSSTVTLAVAGQLEIQPGARLRLDGSQLLTLFAGSAFASSGTLRLDNSASIQINQDTTLPGDWQLSGSASVTGFGALSVPGAHSFQGTFSVPLRLLAGSAVDFNTSTLNSNVTILPAALMTISNSATVVLRSTLTNFGTMSWVSACHVFNLQGPGQVENLGLWQIFQDTACFNGSESVIQVPVNVVGGGKLLLDTNASVDLSGPVNLTLAGALEIRAGARLRLDGSQTLSLLPGSTFTGPGTLRLDNSSQLMLNQDTTLPGDLQMSGSAAVVGLGNLFVPGSHSFAGNFSVPLELLSGAVVNFNTFTVNSNLTVDAGGTMTINTSTSIGLNSALTNFGILRWVSGCNIFNLAGPGHVENFGVWEIFQDPACFNGSESIIQVTVDVPPGGKFLMSTNARVDLSGPSSLTVGGTLEIDGGAQLRMDGSQTITLLAGSSLTGTGTIRLDNSTRLVVPGDFDSTVSMFMNSSSAQLIVPGTYVVRNNTSLQGTVNCAAVDVMSNATLSAVNATFTGFVQVEAGGALRTTSGISIATNVLVNAGGRWDLPTSTAIQLSGTLTNFGTLRWVSGCNLFNLTGPGRVENFGLWQVFADTACFNGSESFIQVPVDVPAGGTFLVSTNARVDLSGPSGLNIAGALEIDDGAQLRMDSSQTTALLAGSNLSGNGTIRLDSSSRLSVPGDFDSTVTIMQNSSGTQLIVPGTYTVRTSRQIIGTVISAAVQVATNASFSAINATFTGLVDVENGATLQTFGGSVSFGSNVLIQAGARWELPTSATLQLSGALTNFGTLHWVSGCNLFNLNGPGQVENFGLWQIYADTACFNGSESLIQVPVDVLSGGQFLVSTNGRVDLSGSSSLTVAGALEIDEGAQLRMDSSQATMLLAGSSLSGNGTIRLDSSSRLTLSGDFDSTVTVVQTSSGTQLTVPGTYTIRTSRQVIGTVNSPAVQIAPNATYNAVNATLTGALDVQNGATLLTAGGTISFSSNVLVEAGARWELPTSATIQLSGALTNFGTLHWVSGCNLFNLTGRGRVENLGLWEAFADTACFNGSESLIQVPVDVPVGGQFLVSTNGRVDLSGPSSLAVAGQFQVQTGSQLRLDNAQTLTLLSGSSANGAGALRFDSSTRLVLPADITLGIGLVNFFNNSSIAGSNLLTIPIGSLILFDHSSTFSGSVTVDGGLTLNNSSATLTIAGALTLDQSGVITNTGTIRVGSFVNNGGTIVGNTPVLIGPGQVAQITSIRLSYTASSIANGANSSAAVCQVILSCLGPAGQSFVIQGSADLRHWSDESGAFTQASSGEIQVTISANPATAHFYRLRSF